jgi:hypothetical protein
MHCWNCHRAIPDTAKMCAHCEAPVMEEPTADELEGLAPAPWCERTCISTDRSWRISSRKTPVVPA